MNSQLKTSLDKLPAKLREQESELIARAEENFYRKLNDRILRKIEKIQREEKVNKELADKIAELNAKKAAIKAEREQVRELEKKLRESKRELLGKPAKKPRKSSKSE